MGETLRLPYFTQTDQRIDYLGQYAHVELDGIKLDSSAGQRLLLAEGIIVRKPQLQAAQEDGRTVAVLEPHPDDLALSASGYVMRSIDDGDRCQSINLFSRTAIERFPWNDKVELSEEQLETLRLQESQLAVEEFLGQRFTSLQLPLASKRGYTEIFADGHKDQVLVQRLGERLTDMLVELNVDTLLSPLAIQGHIDHLVTHDVGMFIKRALGRDIELFLYEDYPYARNKMAYSQRMATVTKGCALTEEYVDVDPYLEHMSSMVIIYRSQFDDTNHDQMHAVMREDLRAVALEAKARGFPVHSECAQRYWRVNES